MFRLVVFGVLGTCFWFPVLSFAGEQNTFTIVIKEHRFEPERLIVPAGEKVKIIIDNQDLTFEEFESYDLNREKMVPGNKKAVIYLGPLKPGEYKYFGEFNLKTAQGVIVAQ